jgi:hypothetical protein
MDAFLAVHDLAEWAPFMRKYGIKNPKMLCRYSVDDLVNRGMLEGPARELLHQANLLSAAPAAAAPTTRPAAPPPMTGAPSPSPTPERSAAEIGVVISALAFSAEYGARAGHSDPGTRERWIIVDPVARTSAVAHRLQTVVKALQTSAPSARWVSLVAPSRDTGTPPALGGSGGAVPFWANLHDALLRVIEHRGGNAYKHIIIVSGSDARFPSDDNACLRLVAGIAHVLPIRISCVAIDWGMQAGDSPLLRLSHRVGERDVHLVPWEMCCTHHPFSLFDFLPEDNHAWTAVQRATAASAAQLAIARQDTPSPPPPSPTASPATHVVDSHSPARLYVDDTGRVYGFAVVAQFRDGTRVLIPLPEGPDACTGALLLSRIERHHLPPQYATAPSFRLVAAGRIIGPTTTLQAHGVVSFFDIVQVWPGAPVASS